MKKLILPILIVSVLSACSDQAGTDKQDSTPANDSQSVQTDSAGRGDTFVPKDSIAKPLDSASADMNQKSSSRTSNGPLIEGTVYYRYSYCGGARPTEEVLKQMEKLYPLPASEIHLRTREKSIVITTDKSGVYAANIPDGTYDIYLIKVPSKVFDISKQNCPECTGQSMGQVKFPNKMKQISFTFPCSVSDRKRP